MWSYLLLLLMVMWILFDGFESYRDYLGNKIKKQFPTEGIILEGEAKGPLLSRTRLLFAMDCGGTVLDARQVYSCRLVPFPVCRSAETLKGRIVSMEDICRETEASLEEQAFFHAIWDYRYRCRMDQLAAAKWKFYQDADIKIEKSSENYDDFGIKIMINEIAEKDIKLENLTEQEKMFLLHLLLKNSRSQKENREERRSR